MENSTLKNLRQELLDGKLRIKHNGIDIFIECPETKENLIIPMTSAEGMRFDPGMDRLASGRGRRGTAKKPDEGQGPYKGFLLIVCEECGAVKAFCAKRETYSFRCDECGYETPLENLRPMYMHCKCGKSFRYKGLPHNTYICGVEFFGPVLIVGTAGEELVSLTEKQVKDLWDMEALRQDGQ